MQLDLHACGHAIGQRPFRERLQIEHTMNGREMNRARAFRDAYAAFLRGRGLEPKIALDGVRVRAAYGADAKLVESFVR